MSELKSYPVWDAPTRWFHWINALCVIALVAAGIVIMNAGSLGVATEGKIALKTVHVLIGYVFAINLLVRLVWAFMGNRHARWSAFLPVGRGYVKSVFKYLREFGSGQHGQYLGHNPAGRLATSVLFLLILVQALTGLVLAGTDLFYPPFGHWIAQWIAAPGLTPADMVPYAKELYDKDAYAAMRAFRAPFIEIHEFGFYALITMVVLHITAVVVTEIREGGGIVTAMFTGRKTLSSKPVDAQEPE